MGINLGLVGRMDWVNSYGRKQCKNLFWRVRATVKKAVRNGSKQQFKFQYDPSSYALNFDDGIGTRHLGLRANAVQRTKFQDYSESGKVMCVYVLWVECQ